jgi:hypothetical protein
MWAADPSNENGRLRALLEPNEGIPHPRSFVNSLLSSGLAVPFFATLILIDPESYPQTLRDSEMSIRKRMQRYRGHKEAPAVAVVTAARPLSEDEEDEILACTAYTNIHSDLR